MKVAKSCSQCRSVKRKCVLTGSAENARCSRCSLKGLRCSLVVGQSSPRTMLRDIRPHSTVPLPPAEMLNDILDCYFIYIHNQPHTFVREDLFRQDVQAGRMHRALLMCILGLSVRFSRFFGDKRLFDPVTYIMEAKRLFQLDLENMSMENIQTALLLANVSFADGKADSEILYFSIAVRMAQVSRLMDDRPGDSDYVRECRRRTYWCMYVADRWVSGGLNVPRLLNFSPDNVTNLPPLPTDELVFQGKSQTVQPQYCVWAQMIRLAYIFGHIQDLNRELFDGTIAFEEEKRIGDTVGDLARQMDHWYESLPPGLRYSDDNLEDFRAKGLARCFVALHLGYHHYSVVLYFQYLASRGGSNPYEGEIPNSISSSISGPISAGDVTPALFAQRCVNHAMWTSNIIANTITKMGCEPLYNAVGHMTIVSSSVLLHNVMFGNRQEVVAAKERLESNFQALLILKKYWPSIELMSRRLRVFQNACQMYSTSAFRMDRWMLKFLLQYAMDLDERDIMQELTEFKDKEKADGAPKPEREALVDQLLWLLSI